MDFMIVRSISPDNGIIGRPGIREIQAVPSTAHRMLKFPADGGIVTIQVAIGGTLSLKGHTELCTLLKKNLDIFTWQPSEMTGVPRSIAEHRLNIREGYSPVRQKKRGQAPEHVKAIQAEVQKLVEAGIMREVYYHDWLSNPVMDCYPLPKIDWKIESLCGYPFKCFLDAYKGYHQIQREELDEEKTAFHTSQGVYCYTKMPFGLKNAGATYQRIVDKAFDSQVSRNMEVYVDDLVIKSHTETKMLRDVDETFHTLRKINMKLNPKNYTFGAVEGMFLGYTITPEGIKLCPDKTEAVLQLPSPRTIKEFQSLNGKLSTPKPKEELIIYLSASYGAVSAVLMTERGTIQTPDYFISRALQGSELNYTQMEKLVLLLVFAAKRLRGTSVKGQILADFLVEKPDENPPDTSAVETLPKPWTQFINGSSCIDGLGAVEYEALIAGLRIAAQMGVRNIQISRNKNKKADALSKIASTSFAHLSKQVLVEVLTEKSIQEKEVTIVVEEEGTTWMTPIVEYLKDGTLPGDRKEASKLRIKARQYELMEGIFTGGVVQYARRTAISSSKGYAAGILLADHAPGRKRYDTYMKRLSNTSPRAKKPSATANPDHGSVAIEAKAVATITGNQVKRFVWDNIVCRFGLPGEIISDNGKKFSDNPFKDWCDKLNITQRFASVKHPQSNELVERANRSLGEGIKACLGEGNKNWIEELPHVLWAHRTMIKSSHGETPFSLTYDTEAVIPVEIGMPTYRTAKVDTVHNDEELRLNLDLLEEKQERAAICEAKSKMKMTKYYNARVRGVAFRPGDFVYRSNDASHAAAGRKLGPKWEGPYEVTETLGDGAYKLRTMDGADLPRTWNIANLKKCYL
ncbi:reverse transcriptase domain-containing protein [Tanacetum coccineum]